MISLTQPSRRQSIKLRLCALALAGIAWAPPLLPAAPERPAAPSLTGLSNLPLYFEANRGQAEGPVQFVARNHDGIFCLSTTEAIVTLRQVDAPASHGRSPGAERIRNRNVRATTVHLQFIAANPQARMSGLTSLPGKVNYFIGGDPANWRANVPTFASVQVENVYPGINLLYYGSQRQLEYDFCISPGADPGLIAFRVSGASDLQIDGQGNLILKLGAGEIRQPKPTIYQVSGGMRKEITGGYRLKGRDTVVLQIGPYNRQLPLIIDPVLSYSSFLGSQGSETARAITLDASGNIYVAGDTVSGQISTTNSFQPEYAGGYVGAGGDAFVAKFDSTGTKLLYLTYLGGNGDDAATSVAVDTEGNAYVTGVTDSTNFPIPSLTISNRISGKGEFYFDLHKYDAFVAKLSPDGSQLVYSTYLGGDGQDEGLGIAVDAAGCAYVAGFTQSTNFPVTAGSFQTTPGGIKNSFNTKIASVGDAFVTKIASNGLSIVYSTFLGGTNDDRAESIAVDALGRAYVTGYTTSTNFPVFANAVQTNRPLIGLPAQVFVTLLESNGASLGQSTYLGGIGSAVGYHITLDNAGNAYVTGSETSPGFPVTPGNLNPGGVFKSGDAAASWAPRNVSLLHNQVQAIGIDPANPSNLYVGTGRGISRSTNSGAAWQVSFDAFARFLTFAVDPVTPSTVYAGTTNVLKSINSGASWFSSSTGLVASATTSATNQSSAGVNKLVIDRLSPATLYAGTDNGVFKSINSATNWNRANNGLTDLGVRDLAMSPLNPATLYAATRSGVFCTTNAGARWFTYNQGLTNALLTGSTNLTPHALAIDSATPSTVYLGTDEGLVFKHTGTDTNWILVLVDTDLIPSNNITANAINVLAVDPVTPTTVYAGARYGLFKTADAGTNWSVTTNGLPALPITTLAVDPLSPSTLYVGLDNFSSGVDAFLTKFTPSLDSVIYSVIFGGYGTDQGWDLAVDGAGNAFVVGSTTSPDFPIFGAVEEPYNSGLNDVFVTAFNPDASAFLYSTLLGGKGDDFGMGIALDSADNAYIVGRTLSPDFPTVNPLHPSLRGNSDGFLAKILFTNPPVNFTLQTVPSGIPVYVDGISNATPVTFVWLAGSSHFVDAAPQSVDTNIQYVLSSWSDGGAQAHPVSAAADATLTANFNLQYFLTVLATNLTANPTNNTLTPDRGVVSPQSGWYDAGTNVTLVATPPIGDLFANWVGLGTNSFSGTNNPVAVTIDGPITETATFTGPLTNRLTILITGNGSVSPYHSGQALRVGTLYSMTAEPSAGFVFSNWTGGVQSTLPKVTFVMTNGLVLQANFVPSPFGAVKGTYAGLFYETNGVRTPSSGFLTATVTDKGAYSGKLQLAGRTYSVSGQFSADGTFFGTLLRSGLTSLQLSLQLTNALAGQITNALSGQISDGIWTAYLSAALPAYSTTNPAPQASRKYTMIIPGAEDSVQQPGGDGYGTVTVDKLGNVTFSGALGDGTKVSQKTFLSGQDRWPLYASLYSGGGMLLGELAFVTNPPTDISGPIIWSKLGLPVTNTYPGGFTIQTEALASLYSFTNGVRVLNLTNGVVVLENGDLSQNITNAFTLNANNTFTGTNRLSLRLTTSSGLFQGTVVDPATGKSLAVKGALLQKQNLGAGFFLNSNQAGRVRLGP